MWTGGLSMERGFNAQSSVARLRHSELITHRDPIGVSTIRSY